MAYKKKKNNKMMDLFDLYLNQFIAGIEPKEFGQILYREHEYLEIKENAGTAILKLKKNVDPTSKSYDFYKTKNGLKLDCIEKYYYHDELPDEGNSLETTATKCFKCQQKIFRLNEYSIDPNMILNCVNCHRFAFLDYMDNKLKLKSQKKG